MLYTYKHAVSDTESVVTEQLQGETETYSTLAFSWNLTVSSYEPYQLLTT